MTEHEKLKSLKRKRGSAKAKVTEFSKYVTTVKETIENDPSKTLIKTTELKIRMKNIEQIWTAFNNIQDEVEEITEDADVENQMEYRSQVENLYYSAAALAEVLLLNNKPTKQLEVQEDVENDLAQSSQVSQAESKPVTLPALSLPSFDGKFDEWITFYDTFNSVIHNNESLTDVAKFRYLNNQLKGDAAQVIQGLTISASNYQTAWSLLIKRYENKKIMIFNHIKAIMDFEKFHKESYTAVRKLLDIIYSNTRALKVLGEPVDTWDRLLIYIIIEKLDNNTAKEWEKQTINKEDMPILQELLDFLEFKCQILQRTDKPNKQGLFKSSGYKTSVHLNTETKYICKVCKEEEHIIYQCPEFIKMSPIERMKTAKQLHLCTNCLRYGHTSFKCKGGKCRKCHRWHNTMLHQEQENKQVQNEEADTTALTVNNNAVLQPSQILLATAIIQVKDNQGKYHAARALLDGGSQSNFVTSKFANKLNCSLTNSALTVTGISNNQTSIQKSTTLEIRSNYNNYKNIMEFLLIPKITCKLPTKPVTINNLPTVTLADQNYHKPGEIDMLLGAECYLDYLLNEQIKLGHKSPILQKTVFGWVISGPVNNNSKDSNPETHVHVAISSLEDKIEKFWKIEELPEMKHLSKEEQECEQHYTETVTKDESGRFIVNYPFKASPTTLGESKQTAIKRLHYYEKRAATNSSLKQQYMTFMKEYEDLGHMTKIEEQNEPKFANYLPHHAVFKQNSVERKIRVVFDASCKTSNGYSLNDILKTGPTIQQNLFEIVTRFRQHQYVLTADVTKMYRQILIAEQERDVQRIVWRERPDEPIQIFRLNTVTYGTSSAPFLAVRTLKQIAYDHLDKYPTTCQRILEDFYVDDLLTGCDNPDDLIQLRDELTTILKSSGFHLTKWLSNSDTIAIDKQDTSKALFTERDKTTRTLGISWIPFKDAFSFEVPPDNTEAFTKRQILTKISKLFDPLGLLGPTITFAKLIMQSLWQIQSDWDEIVPNNILEKWKIFQENTIYLNNINIPRCISQPNSKIMELHGFADASEDAYGAVMYLRSTSHQGDHAVRIICSKSRVAPLKKLSLPRLELCAALLLSKLYKSINQALKLDIQSVTLWSDSTITLWWINTEPNKLKTFVANRVSEIQTNTEQVHWRHVSSKENPADMLSRGCLPQDMVENKLWWNGPDWLVNNEETWPVSNVHLPPELQHSDLELKPETSLCHQTTTNLDHFQKYSDFNKLQRIIAYCLRFIKNAKNTSQARKIGVLTVSELDEAVICLIQQAQRQCFSKEIDELKNHKPVSTTSSLKSLNPFMDTDNLLRVGGRLLHSNISHDQKFPILLPKNHFLTKLIIKDEHIKSLHAGSQVVLSNIRKRFWPIAAKGLIRKILHDCVICTKTNAKLPTQLMGNLPYHRVNPSRPFTNAGVDFCGPFETKIVRLRGKTTIKTYVAVFVCLATRAVHLELVNSLTTQAFLGALRRFICRRGKCINLYCDNATNFVGAKNELYKLYDFLQSKNNQDLIQTKMAQERINFHFIPPRSPHMGGIWEAAVKSAKTHFKRVAANANLTIEEMTTLLAQIEACLNSRPLCKISSDPTDETVLTPSHFLIGEPPSNIPEPDIPINSNALTYWQKLQTIYQHFWKRWSNEYLATLQQRVKWQRKGTPIKVGDVVIIREPTPPTTWKMGYVTETHSGSDGEIRVVSVKTTNGVVKRAIQKLCVLPINHDLKTDTPVTSEEIK